MRVPYVLTRSWSRAMPHPSVTRTILAQKSGGSHRQRVIYNRWGDALINHTAEIRCHSITTYILNNSGDPPAITEYSFLWSFDRHTGSCSGYCARYSLSVSLSIYSSQTSSPIFVKFHLIYEPPEWTVYKQMVYAQIIAQARRHSRLISPFIDALPPVSWW